MVKGLSQVYFAIRCASPELLFVALHLRCYIHGAREQERMGRRSFLMHIRRMCFVWLDSTSMPIQPSLTMRRSLRNIYLGAMSKSGASSLIVYSSYVEACHVVLGECVSKITYSWIASRITKIFKITKDLEHNNYAHVTTGLRIVTLASHAFLTQDVVSPPPSLLSRNIDVYASQVHMNTH